jgi:hypothetical protein
MTNAVADELDHFVVKKLFLSLRHHFQSAIELNRAPIADNLILSISCTIFFLHTFIYEGITLCLRISRHRLIMGVGTGAARRGGGNPRFIFLQIYKVS